jgi:hypothetical protein
VLSPRLVYEYDSNRHPGELSSFFLRFGTDSVGSLRAPIALDLFALASLVSN